MDLREIKMDQWDAYSQLADYRKALRDVKENQRRREDRDTMRALLALSRGRRVVSLRAIFAACPVTVDDLPALAIARADAREVDLFVGDDWRVSHRRVWRFTASDRQKQRGPEDQSLVLRVESRSPASKNAWSNALVPSIPPWLRPPNLSDYHILWEAEWRRVAPKDPALLKRLTSDLFVVLATWDLSPVERAVLEAARLAPRPR